MKSQKQLTCTVCPIGCSNTVTMEDGKINDISGYTCKRGLSYAQAECTDPRRTLTTSMKLTGGTLPLVSVKTKDPIPKRLLFDAMAVVNRTPVPAPVRIGDVLIKDVLGTGIDVVATRNVPKKGD